MVRLILVIEVNNFRTTNFPLAFQWRSHIDGIFENNSHTKVPTLENSSMRAFENTSFTFCPPNYVGVGSPKSKIRLDPFLGSSRIIQGCAAVRVVCVQIQSFKSLGILVRNFLSPMSCKCLISINTLMYIVELQYSEFEIQTITCFSCSSKTLIAKFCDT